MPGLTPAPQAFRATLRAKDDRPVRPQHSYALRLQVHRGVYVAVEVRTAFRARPRSNRQSKLVSYVPALRARFRGRELGIDANDVTSLSFGLVLDHTDELTPTRIRNGTGEMTVLEHVLDFQSLGD